MAQHGDKKDRKKFTQPLEKMAQTRKTQSAETFKSWQQQYGAK